MKLKWKELVASLIVIWLPLIYALSIYADLSQLIRGHLPYSGSRHAQASLYLVSASSLECNSTDCLLHDDY